MTNAYFIHQVSRADVNGLKIFEIGKGTILKISGCVIVFEASTIGVILANSWKTLFTYISFETDSAYSLEKQASRKLISWLEREGERLYVQICYLLADDKTIQREFGNLEAIDDKYAKYVVSMDPIMPPNTYKGIRQVSLQTFLLLEQF